MAQAVRAKNDFPDTVYFDDWFTQVPAAELVGKTVYVKPNCISFDCDKLTLNKLKVMGVNIMTKKGFDATLADYVIVSGGWTKTQKCYISKEEKLAMAEWKKRGAPLRLYWDHIRKEIG